MGNSLACFCCTGAAAPRRRHVAPAALPSDPAYDEGLGHSFCYVRPDKLLQSYHYSTAEDDLLPDATAAAAAAGEEATTFRAISGAALSANVSTPLSTSALLLLPDDSSATTATVSSGFESSDSFAALPLQPIPRFPSGPISSGGGFLSGPIERGFLSGPLDPALLSGPLPGPAASARLAGPVPALRRSLSHGGRRIRDFTRAILSRADRFNPAAVSGSLGSPDAAAAAVAACGGDASGLQWAQGKAGEDRVHVVVSEERGWVFVGIYDGFNGPDATDYLVNNLYASVCRELVIDDHPPDDGDPRSPAARRRHGEVLDALARALRRTEEGYFAEAEARAAQCPELAMMGSCVLVVLMKGAHVYSMNVGDSRAVLAHRPEPDLTSVVLPPRQRHGRQNGVPEEDLAGVTEEIKRQFDECDMTELLALQLTMEHSTGAYKEVRRIRSEHLDDPACIVNDRVKGSLKVTRAFGAGYLKEPRWNKALLEVFRVDYVGASPYITCKPFLRHHCLGPRDKFLILASDGLYEYFTNEDVVARVEAFVTRYPDEDPAKYLSHEILLRAANQAGMGFHELLEVQQGDRRQYHDDVSIIIISLEGKIWRSSA